MSDPVCVVFNPPCWPGSHDLPGAAHRRDYWTLCQSTENSVVPCQVNCNTTFLHCSTLLYPATPIYTTPQGSDLAASRTLVPNPPLDWQQKITVLEPDSVHGTLDTGHLTLDTVPGRLFIVQFTLYQVHCIRYTVPGIMHNVRLYQVYWCLVLCTV